MYNLQVTEWHKIMNIIEHINSIMDRAQFCNEFLYIIKNLIPFNYGHFTFYDQDKHLLPISYRYNIGEKTHQSYLKYYKDLDHLRIKKFDTKKPKKGTDIIDYRKWKKSEYFNDFFLKNNFYYISLTDIHYKDKLLSSISLIRNKKSYDFSDKELIYLQILSPHIANHLYKLQVIKKTKEKNENKIINLISKKQSKLKFTNREQEIVNEVIKGKINSEISDLLYISTETVKKHLNSVFKKSDVSNRTELLARLIDLV